MVRPDPIPNSVVKRSIGDDNEVARLCENTPLPGFVICYLTKVRDLFYAKLADKLADGQLSG